MELTEEDWTAVNHSRFGPSVDLVVSLLLRGHLSRSDLVRVDVLSGEALDMDRSDWPASWAELVSSVEAGVSFRVGLCLRSGMDATARTAELDSLRFPADLNWDVLDQGYTLQPAAPSTELSS